MKEKTKGNDAATQSKATKVIKAILNTVINIMIVVVLITSLLIAVMALTSKANGISTFFGYTVQPIQSDSMKGGSPDGYGGSDFAKGDLMIAKATNFDSSAEYDIGDIVTYMTEDYDGNTILMAHRIIDAVKNDDGIYVYQTQGDNRAMSQVPDQSSVEEYLRAEDIASVYYTSDYEGKILKGMGAPLDYLRTQQGFFFIVLMPMIVFFLYELIRVVLSASNYRRAKEDENKQNEVNAAVAAALAAKEAENAAPAETPADMTPEQLEQFKQFMEFQKAQNAAKEAEQKD